MAVASSVSSTKINCPTEFTKADIRIRDNLLESFNLKTMKTIKMPLIQEFIDMLKEHNAVIAGSFVVGALTDKKFKSNDIDIWLPHGTKSLFAIFGFLCERLQYNHPVKIGTNSNYKRLIKYVNNIYALYPITTNSMTIQIMVLKRNITVQQVVKSFDLECTQIMYSPNNLECPFIAVSNNAITHIQTMQTTIGKYASKIQTFVEWKRTIGRIFKYIERGFAISDWTAIIDNVNKRINSEIKEKYEVHVANLQIYPDKIKIDEFLLNEKGNYAHEFLSVYHSCIQYLSTTLPCELPIISRDVHNTLVIEEIPKTLIINKSAPTKCFSFTQFDDIESEDWVGENVCPVEMIDNIVILEEIGDGEFNSLAMTKGVLKTALVNNSNIYYKCSSNGKTIELDKQYFQINLLNMNVLVTIKNIEQMLCTKEKYWIVKNTNVKFNRTASKNAVGINANYVSAHHCQNGTAKTLYELRAVKFIPTPTVA